MKHLFLALLMFSFFAEAFSQNNPRPSRSRFFNNKYSTFKVKAGDILVYHVKNNADEYDLIVTVKKFGPEINFDFEMTEKDTKGNVNIQAAAVSGASKYHNFFTSNNQNFSNQSTIWLSKKNYRELVASRRTMMDMGNENQVFARTINTTHKINFKGKQKIVTVHSIESQGTENKSNLHILTEPDNPLIVFIDKGWTMTLKEVR
ncbi:MAG: hypothetical protein JWQ96_3035 [Segetibacter sp.]|nr:hypothetical protein [Segetibacter sp.]